MSHTLEKPPDHQNCMAVMAELERLAAASAGETGGGRKASTRAAFIWKRCTIPNGAGSARHRNFPCRVTSASWSATGKHVGIDFLSTWSAHAQGSLLDQIGHGFHRYSVDGHGPPLRENAQQAPFDACQATGEVLYGRIAEEILNLSSVTSPLRKRTLSPLSMPTRARGTSISRSPSEISEVLGDRRRAPLSPSRSSA